MSNSTIDQGIAKLRELVSGRSVAVLGSAPGAHRVPRCDLICAVNGSAAAFGLGDVDIHVLNAFSQSRPDGIWGAVQEAIEGLTCDYSIYIDVAEIGRPPANYRKCQWTIARADRSLVYGFATGDIFAHDAGGEQVPSTGVFAAMLLRRLGADVVLAGFSLDHGHALLDGAHRGHVEIDRKYVAALTRAEPEVASL